TWWSRSAQLAKAVMVREIAWETGNSSVSGALGSGLRRVGNRIGRRRLPKGKWAAAGTGRIYRPNGSSASASAPRGRRQKRGWHPGCAVGQGGNSRRRVGPL